MSECITRVTKIHKIIPHENADALELAKVDGWQCVIPKGVYSEGDACVYIPIDSVLPLQLEETLLGGAKVKLNKGRVKTIRLRGQYSQGLVANIETIKEYLGNHGCHIVLHENTDITKELGIKKYEPKLPSFQQFQKTKVRYQNPEFYKYASIENIKNYTRLFEPEEEVIVTEKIHGTNFRAGWVRKDPKAMSLMQKVMYYLILIFNKKSMWEFTVGSHNVQLDPEGDNVYSEMARRLELKNKLAKGEILYGEIYGPNIQKGYHYGLKDGERGFVAFDLRVEGKYQTFEKVQELEKYEGIPVVPVLYSGKYEELNLDEIVGGDSVFAPEQKIREGVVVRSPGEQRKILKCINPEYLMKGAATEYH